MMNKFFNKNYTRHILSFITVGIYFWIPFISFANECGIPQLQVQTSWRTGTVIDNSDNIHLALLNYINDSMNLYYSKLDRNGAVIVDDLQLSVVSNSVGPEKPSIAVSSSGDAYVIWTDNRDGNWEIYCSHIDQNGNIITGEKRLTNDPATSWEPSINVDSTGSLHIVWIDTRDGNTEIYYKKIDNSGNDIISDMRLTNTNSLKGALSSDIDSGDNIRMVWIGGNGGNNKEVYYLQITSNGVIIVNELQLSSTAANNGYPHIAIDNNGNSHVVWAGNMTGNWAIYYARFDADGNRMAPDMTLSDISSNSGDSYIKAKNGKVYITFTSDIGGKPDIYYTVLDFNGNIIENTKKISNGQAASWSPSVAADSSGNPHFVWLDGYMMANQIYAKSVTAVTGYDPRKEKNDVINNLAVIKGRLGSREAKHIKKAISNIEKALKDSRWSDSCHLVAKDGKKVFKDIKHAIHDILKAVKKVKDETIKEDLTAQIILLYEADKAISIRSLNDAKNSGGNTEMIKKGADALAKAEALMSQNKHTKAIDSLAKAWKYGIKARQ